MSVNAYSRRWHATFSAGRDQAETAREVEALRRWLPLPECRDVLDVCCGYGRHALGLAAHGYRVTGVERDPEVAREARRRGAHVVELDMRELDSLEGRFGAVISMWASFGYFDDATNAAVLGAMARKLGPGGRLLLDVWSPAFFRERQGRRKLRPGVLESTRVDGERLHVRLDYGGDAQDELDFRLYLPAELVALAGPLRLVHACSRFDEGRAPDGTEPRQQLLFSA